ncbi:MAG: S49 family peptidase, partial [Pseudomonadota bacterium]
MLRVVIRKIRSMISGIERAHIPVLRLEGVIGGKGYGKKGLCLDSIKKGLEEAFDFDKKSKLVILVINSPGGSPAQSSLIYKYLCHLKKKYEKKLIVLVEDVAASGGYYIACAADEIYADDHSITGSIGVVSSGFGFVKAIDKIGIERRVHTSGENKSILDPFSEEKAEDIAHLKAIQSDIHDVFKNVVKERRGEKLVDVEKNEIFTGKFWAA